MRVELLDYLRGLSDKNYQLDCWINKDCPSGTEHDELDFAVHFLFDDTNLASDAKLLIGDVVRDEKEAVAIKAVCDSLEGIFIKYGFDRSDAFYIGRPEWASVVSASMAALKTMDN